MDDSAKGIYDMILDRYILTQSGLNQRCYNNSIEGDDGTCGISTVAMIDMGEYEFKYCVTIKITTEELFMNAYTEEAYESEHVCTSNKVSLTILDAKY